MFVEQIERCLRLSLESFSSCEVSFVEVFVLSFPKVNVSRSIVQVAVESLQGALLFCTELVKDCVRHS